MFQNKESEQKKLSRRKLLQILTAMGLSPLTLQTLQPRLYGAPASQNSGRRWIKFQLRGAPNRTMSDLFLDPLGQGGFAQNPLGGNQYVAENGRYVDTRYHSIVRHGLHVPPMWGESLTSPGTGNTLLLSDLLKNMIQFRGVDVSSEDHTAAISHQFTPPGTGYSLAPLAAQTAFKPFAALNYQTLYYEFQGEPGLVAMSVPGDGNPLAGLMAPFMGTGGASNGFSAASAGILAAERQQILAQNRNHGAGLDSRSGIELVKDRGFPDDLAEEWTSILRKYEGIVQSVLQRVAATPDARPIQGISDLPVGSSDVANRSSDYHLGNRSLLPMAADLRTMFSDIVRFVHMAESFAVAEFLVKYDLTNSLALGLDGTNNLRTAVAANTRTLHRVSFDHHFLGAMPSLILCTAFDISLYSCMAEFVQFLKNDGSWNNTIIQVAGEFGRNFREDGSGSDHAGKASSTVFFSGAIEGAHVLGDIVRGQPGTGTYGVGAPNSGHGTFTITDQAASIATMLGVRSPYTAARSLVQNVNGLIVPMPYLQTGKFA